MFSTIEAGVMYDGADNISIISDQRMSIFIVSDETIFTIIQKHGAALILSQILQNCPQLHVNLHQKHFVKWNMAAIAHSSQLIDVLWKVLA